MLLHSLLYCVLMWFSTVSSSRVDKQLSILVVQPLMSPSHHVWTVSLIKGLLRKGHRVHVVSIQETKVEDTLAQNLTFAAFDDLVKDMFENDYDPTEWTKFNVIQMISFLYDWAYDTCKSITKTETAKNLLEMVKNVEFDVIVQDVTLNECMYGLWEVAKNNPPVVGFVPFGPSPWLKDLTGASNYPNVRTYCYSGIAKIDDFWKRVQNTYYYFIDDYIRYFHYLPKCQQLAEQYVGHKLKPLYEFKKNVGIVLINSHPSFEYGIPLPPNALEIGGLHAQSSHAVTDEKIREFLDGATNGAIMISLGTNVQWKSVETKKIEAVILALSKLKQRVLWKLKLNMSLQLPDNVMVASWIPQGDILTHKNLKAVWTHGGLLSTQEAIWHGVPIIGMPFFADQILNIGIIVNKGAGVRLDFTTLTTQSVLNAFEQVVYNKSYMENMKRLSDEFRDRPIKPLDLAVWSIEHTARHRTGILATPLRSQCWIVQKQIDVYVMFFFGITLILSIVYIMLKVLFRFCYQRLFVTSKSSKSKQA